MKLFGIIIILIGDILLILNYESIKKERVDSSEALIRFLQYLNINVMEKKMTFPDAILQINGSISDYIDSFIRITDFKNEDVTVRESLILSMKAYFSDCDSELLKYVTDYISILGNMDKKTMTENYDVTMSQCSEIIKMLKKEYEKNTRLIRITVFSVSIIAILVIM